MTAFSKRLYCEGAGYVDFAFNEYYTGDEMKYRVTGNFHFYILRFTMHENEGEWKISNPNETSEEIIQFEQQLSDAIVDQKRD